MGYLDIDMGPQPDGPSNRCSTHNSIGTKYEYLKHILDNEIGCYLEEIETSEGNILVQKSRLGKIIKIIPWDGNGNVVPNPDGVATKELKKLGIGQTIYSIETLPSKPVFDGNYALIGRLDKSIDSWETTWISESPIDNYQIQEIWDSTSENGDYEII